MVGTYRGIVWARLGAPALRFAARSAAVSLVVCATVLLGWVIDSPILKSALPGRVAMRPWGAVMFALIAVSIWCSARRSRGSSAPAWFDAVAVIAAAGAGVIGFVSLVEYAGLLQSSFDTWLFPIQVRRDGVVFPGRIAQATALAGALMAAAILCSLSRRRSVQGAAPLFILITAVIGMLGICGFLYNANSIYSTAGYRSVSLPTAILIFVLGCGILALRPGSALLSPVLSRHSGGGLARRLLPGALAIPFVFGWLRLEGELRGWYGTLIGLTFYTCANVITFGVLVLITARRLNSVDSRREAGDHAARVALSVSEDRYRTLAESLPHLVWTCRPDGWCDYVSPQWVSYTGVPAGLQLGSRWTEQLHPDDLAAIAVQWSLSIKSGEAFDVQFRIRRHDGAYRWFRSMSVPVRDTAGQIVKWFGSNTDIDDRKRAEAELQELTSALERRIEERTAELRAAKDRAESADRLKTDFITTMSHELRTPLNSIIGFTGTLLTQMPGTLNAAQDQQLRIVQSSGRHLLMLINDVLDVARIETGAFVVASAAVDAGQLIREIAAELSPLAVMKGLTIETVLSASPVMLQTDVRALRQILVNLVSNAIKFTDRGAVIISASRSSRAGLDRVELAVSDSGIGIEAAALPKLFLKFSRVHEAQEAVAGGTGLGLYLCRLIADRLNANIRVESEPGKGSCFTVTFD